MFNLTGFGPLFADFFQLFRFSNIPFEVTAILADIIIKRSNGNNADGDAVTAEGTAFRQHFNSRIHFFGSTFGAFSLFQIDTSLSGYNGDQICCITALSNGVCQACNYFPSRNGPF